VSKVSAYVLTYNEEDKIRDALTSITWADEIVVLDSHSTDGTLSICREFTEKVYQCDFEGFGKLRNRALEFVTHDWVLSLDADERGTVELRDEIKTELARGPRAEAFFVARKNLFLGRWIRHGGWYPDYRQPQFFNKHRFRYQEDLVHEGYQVDGRVDYLQSHVMQVPFLNLSQFLQKMSRYSSLMAEQMARRGRRFHAHQLVSHPLFTFLKMYVARQGFRDGMPGLILALLYAYYSFVKYAKLWERTRATYGELKQ
jgi:glycosyltransferase involved in cell wall biosynthesis